MPDLAPPRGTQDLLPADESGWRWLHDAHRQVAASHGYQLIDTPIFESTELFARGVGAGTDVVDKEMYTFTDRGGRSVTLRPEGTAGVLRAVLGAHLEQQLRPVRVHYAGPMFRYDRPQKGRRRQFSTVGVECIGERSPHLDAEVIEMAALFFGRLGITGLSLQLNTLGNLEDRQRYRQALIDHFLPRQGELCEQCRRRLDINPLRLLDCKTDATIVAGAPGMSDSLSAASADYFATVTGALRAAGVDFMVNPRLARGLDYYSDTAFEFWHTSLEGAQNALGGGGRYDGLAEVMGAPATPGVGYGLGVERILNVAETLAVLPAPLTDCEVVVGSADPGTAAAAALAARGLRRSGLRVILDAGDRRLDRKLRDAARRNAAVMVIIGQSEAASGDAVVRDLRSREQRTVPLSSLAGEVGDAVAAGRAQ